MNKLFLSLLLSVFCCLACKSQANHDAIPSGIITANIDGVATSFDINSIAVFSKPGSGKGSTYVIRGFKNTSKNADVIALGVISRQQIISAGTYDDSNKEGSYTTDIQLLQRGKNVISYISTKAIIAITFMQNGSIQGTFNGVLKGSSGPNMNITNGSFNVKIETK
jgi:hypothetical protein